MVDFDLPKKSYEKAVLILCKIYIYNNMSNQLYNVYDYYRNVAKTDTFDDMVLKSKEVDEDIIQKESKLNAIFEIYEDNHFEEDDFDDDLKEDIFDGIKNLFDGIKKEIDKIEKNKTQQQTQNDDLKTEHIDTQSQQQNKKEDNDDDTFFI